MAFSTAFKNDYGTDTPVNDAVLQTYPAGAFRTNQNVSTWTLGLIGWVCTVAGHPGTWIPIYGSAGGPVLSAHPGSILFSNGDGLGGVGPIIAEDNNNLYFDDANNRIILGNGAPYTPVAGAPLTIVSAHTDNTALLLSKSGLQRIQKTNGKLDIVVPDLAGDFNLYMGTTKKITVEPGSFGGPSSVFTLNNTGTWAGTFAHWATGQTYITQTAFDGSNQSFFNLTGGALINQSSGQELNDVIFDLSHTVQQVGGLNHVANRAITISAPTYSSTSTHTVDVAALLYLNGAPTAGTGATLTQKLALWIGAGNGGAIRTDGFGASGLIKNNNGSPWTLGVPGTDFLAPFSLTNKSVVISGGGSVLTEDNAYFYYETAKHRHYSLGQTIFGAGTAQSPSITFNSETFDATELTGAIRDTGFYGFDDNMFAATTGGFPSTVFTPQGLSTFGLQTRTLWGGTEGGRDDSNALVIFGGSTTTLRGLKASATNTFSATSGAQSGLFLSYTGAAGGFAPTSGTATFSALDLAYEVNQTGGANGTVNGLNVIATRTAVGGTHNLATFGTTTRNTMRVTDSNTEAWVYVGEQSTGFVDAALFLQTNARQAYFYLDNATALLTINSSGLQATALAGTGSQLIQANAGGTLSRSTLTMPSSGVVPSSTVALTGPAVVWTDSSGLLNVDTTRFVYDATNFSLRLPNGTITNPSWTPIGDTNTGMYSNAADSLGVATNGKATARFEQDISSRFFYLGASATGVTGYAYLGFETNVRAGAIYLDNAVGNALISTVPFFVPNGSAVSPSLSFVNNTDTGLFRHSVGRVGIAAGGFQVARAEAISTDRDFWIGQSATGVTGLAYLGFETNAHTGAIYVKDSVGDAIIVSVALLGQNGTAAAPSISLVNSTNTGLYQYVAGKLAVSSAGRHTARFESDASSRFIYIGEQSTGITGYAWMGFETNVRAGAIYMDNAVGNALISTVPFFVPNGSAASPSLAFTNSTDTGYYRYAAGSLGMAAAGRFVARAESDSTSRYLYLGEQSTGITASAYLGFQTNVRAGYILLDNASNYFTWGTGGIQFGASGTMGTWDGSVGLRSSYGFYAGASGATNIGVGRQALVLGLASTAASAASVDWNYLYVIPGAMTLTGSTHVTSTVGIGSTTFEAPFFNTAATIDVASTVLIIGAPFLNSGGGALTYPFALKVASGESYFAGAHSVGDTWTVAANHELFKVVGGTGSGRDRIILQPGGAGYVVVDGGLSRLIEVTPAGATLVARATTPVGTQVVGTYFGSMTYTASGVSGNAGLSDGSATVYIAGPPIMSGINWTTVGREASLWVESGLTHLGGELRVGLTTNQVFSAVPGSSKLLGFFGNQAAKQTVSGSRSANAALASLCSALATYGLIVDSTT